MLKFSGEGAIPQEKQSEEERIRQQAIEFIEKIENGSVELGAGRAGRVFSQENSAICVKEFNENSAQFATNSAEHELLMQREVLELGIRGPEPMFVATSDRGVTYFVMETIKGHSIREVIEKKLDLPEAFNISDFFTKLKGQVVVMHRGDIYHRDLHDGNVMIEWSTSNPIIIDFGFTKKNHDDGNPYLERNYPVAGNDYHFIDDLDHLKTLRKKLERYLTSRI